MILENDGVLFELSLSEMSVALRLQIKNENVSGSTSSTDTVNSGTKAKKLTVSGVLPFKRSEHLTDLIKVAEAIDSDGDRVVYSISEGTANATNIRQVIFDGDFSVRKIQELNAWNVSFSLREKNSIAEANANLATANETPVSDTATGTVVAMESPEASVKKINGMLFNLITHVEDFLGKNEDK